MRIGGHRHRYQLDSPARRRGRGWRGRRAGAAHHGHPAGRGPRGERAPLGRRDARASPRRSPPTASRSTGSAPSAWWPWPPAPCATPTNGPEFRDEIQRRFGIDARTISGDEEARLTFLGATAGRDAGAATLVIDIGGGSTEYVTGQPGSRPGLPRLDAHGLRAPHRASPARRPADDGRAGRARRGRALDRGGRRAGGRARARRRRDRRGRYRHLARGHRPGARSLRPRAGARLPARPGRAASGWWPGWRG